ncbi:phosphate acetyltransferase [Halomonas halocynthiae]|uniref:phosphate acetyltransferase n=1 Tax=Halomonas halocynthiae TaxID=176290 RepID=UPI0004227E71|nr:phosphate acetyltransferase [Halomonas halocynthiae]
MTSPRTLLLVPTDGGVGLTSACLGLLRGLDTLGVKAGYFKPLRQDEESTEPLDHSSALIANTLGLAPPPPTPKAELERLLADNRSAELMESAVAKLSLLRRENEPPAVVVVEGLAPNADTSYAATLNAQLARALDANIILVASSDSDDAAGLLEQIDMQIQAFGGRQIRRVLGCMLMRLPVSAPQHQTSLAAPEATSESGHQVLTRWQQHLAPLEHAGLKLIAAVPWQEGLSVPRTLDIARALNARCLNEGDMANRRVLGTSLCARSAAHMLHAFQPGRLIVTSGDRDDTLLAAAMATLSGVQLSGIVLTHNEPPNQAMVDFCRPALASGLPVLTVAHDSFTTASKLDRMGKDIPLDDTERAEQVTRFVAAHLDLAWLRETMSRGVPKRLSPAAFRHRLVEMAVSTRRRIVLPEGNEPRTVEAAVICQRRGIADCVLLGERESIEAVAAKRGLTLPDGLTVINPAEVRQEYVAPMVALRGERLNALTAKAQLQDNVVLGTMMLAESKVDGLVSGAIHTTANTVRPAFQLIKTAPGYNQVSSIFFMLLPDQVVVYGDCAVIPDPDAETLAEIAIQSAHSASAFGIEPRVAMISYSTGQSGTGSDVVKVREATRIAREKAPELIIDGPLQYDAAAIESVGRQKAPDSPVAGRATVFVFPDLNTGNTTYKAVQRSANCISVGPMLQGLNKPVNDLSRGARVDDIVYTIALTAIQAGQRAH